LSGSGCLNIADIPTCLTRTVLPENILNKRYSKFFSDTPQKPFKISLKPLSNKNISKRIFLKRHNNSWQIWGRGINISMSRKSACGEIFPDINILDSLLRIIYSYLLVKNGGFLIHAAAADGGVFTGPAGSGKTTSVRSKNNILGDDIVALRKINNTWYIYSTPFTGEFEGKIASGKEELKEFYILDSSRKNLKPSEFYKKLFRNLIYFFPDRQGMNRLTQYCKELSLDFPAHGYKNKQEYSQQAD
jgi:hypothetical protein